MLSAVQSSELGFITQFQSKAPSLIFSLLYLPLEAKLSGVARGRDISSGSKEETFEGWNGPSPVGTIRSFQCSRSHQLYCSSLYLWLITSLTLGRVIMAVPLSAPHSLLSAPHMGLASAKCTSRSELSPLYFIACIRPYVFPPHHKHAMGWEGVNGAGQACSLLNRDGPQSSLHCPPCSPIAQTPLPRLPTTQPTLAEQGT